MNDLRFSCTSCGRCCHNLRLPLGANEAIAWVERGGLVQLLCHAAPDLGAIGAAADYGMARRFAARSGDLSIRVQAMLVARFDGACPNLLPDMRCGIYADRPNTCRSYPAEIIPGLIPDPAAKLCPPDAWSDRQPPLLSTDGSVLDPVTAIAIRGARAAQVREVPVRSVLTRLLEIDVAALENEGFAIWTPDPARLVDALREAIVVADHGDLAELADWSFVSPRPATAALIGSAGARLTSLEPRTSFDYHPLYKGSG